MKTASDHNRDFMAERTVNTGLTYAGVLCDKCESELVFSSPGVVLTSNPPQVNVHCLNCGYKTTIF